jgi:uncharacterized membrane protein YdcZ (DUF606 family)
VAIWSYVLFGLLGGAMLPIQFGINGQLAEWLGGSVRAAFVSFFVAVSALLVPPSSGRRRGRERAAP